MELLLLILLSSMYVSLNTVLCCEFPIHWHGRWYQSTFGYVTISSNEITRKGRCIQRSGGRYLISSLDSNCYKCLVITHWHTNILQYKESRCWSADSIDSICGRIHGDVPLFTLVKVPSQPVPCPFQGYYTFSYANSTTGSRQCQSTPPSEIKACADESKFKFVYKHCPGMPETYNKVLDFQCLATWENGEKFLYGKFTSPHLAGREQMYRCFMHNFYGMGGEMSMTADATCQGLQSPTVGFSTMRLDKVLDGSIWPRSFRRYPDFFTRRKHWRDLSGRFIVEVDNALQIFKIKDRFPGNVIEYSENEVWSEEIKMVVRCVEHVDRHSTSHVKKYIVHATDDTCNSGYRCLMLVKRSHKVLELHIGRPTNDLRVQCDDSQFTGAEKHILIPDNDKSTDCPAEGSFTYMDKSSDCRGRFNIGCKNRREMEIESSCRTNELTGTAKVDIYQCLVQWKEDDTHYVIAQKSGDVRKEAKCLAFRHTQSGLDVQEDSYCGKNRMVLRNGVINYVLFKPADKCVEIKPKVPSPPTDTLPPKGITSDRSSIIDANSSSNKIRTDYSLCVMVLLTFLHYQLGER